MTNGAALPLELCNPDSRAAAYYDRIAHRLLRRIISFGGGPFVRSFVHALVCGLCGAELRSVFCVYAFGEDGSVIFAKQFGLPCLRVVPCYVRTIFPVVYYFCEATSFGTVRSRLTD